MEKLLKPKNDEFSAISGMKVISMFLIIYGHRMMMSFFSPMHNSLDVEMAIGEFINIYFYNGIVIVNTFLVITGFLTYYKALNDISHNTKISIIQYVYRRWMRLTPAYLYVMTFVLNVVPYIEQGPLGRNVIWDYSPCYKYLWTHLLFINNYVHVENQCLIPSWYMATDMQLYIICSLLAFFFWKSEKIGKLLLFATAMVFIITPGLVVIKGHYNGVVLLFHRDFHHYFNQNEFIETYLQTHSRASPYLIGMLGAYVYKQLKDKKKTFSKFYF
ncbi:hypothetical protein AAG570_007607 [Ranatra chinensis]|uniref:Acyltransferase 3 domain-containing protein n=1 Tax=Ranatra chinensis TaxID=642074 RepID=A0ABD0Y793_9HEMI